MWLAHACRTSPTGLSAATVIGRYCTVGQGCLLRSATIEHECIVGDRSILLEGSLMESHSVLAPGSVLPPGRLVPARQLWAGNPARFVRDLTKDEARSCCTVLACAALPLCHQRCIISSS
jgi:carbonic anhydrase/acetyltransferase-like protein (isoleucine patch superfamily)